MRSGLFLICLSAVCFLPGCQTDQQTRSQRAQIRQALNAFQHSINARSFEAIRPYLAPDIQIEGLPAELSLAGLKAGMHWTRDKVVDIQLLSMAKTSKGANAHIALYMSRSVMELRMGFDFQGKITSIDAVSRSQASRVSAPKAFTSHFLVNGRLMYVRATVNGRSGFFLFDTGASRLLLNKKYFQPEAENGMAGISSTVAGLRQRLGRATVHTLQWETLRLKDTYGELHDLSRMESPAITPLLGAISYQEIKDSAIVLDWDQRTIQVFATKGDGSKKIAQDQSRPGMSVPFFYSAHLPVIKAQIGKKTYALLFDSGAESNALPDDMGLEAHFKQVGTAKISDGTHRQSAPVPAGYVDETLIGGSIFRNLPFVIHSTPYLPGKGFLGTPLLNQVDRMEINFRTRKMTFWR